jgi:hypothetical protein
MMRVNTDCIRDERDRDGRAAVIEVRIRELSQLFNTFDPSPFHERDLDDDAEAYIVGWAQELPRNLPIRLVVHLPEAEQKRAQERGLATALGNFFTYRANMISHQLNELFREGNIALVIGLAVLAACLFSSQLVRRLGTGPLESLIEQSLIILGWVGNWRPLEIYLYAWWPLTRRRNLYRRLAAAEVRLIADAHS